MFNGDKNIVILILLITLCLASCSSSIPKELQEQYALLPEKIDYNIHVKPILSDRCFACHGNDKNKLKAGLRLDNQANAFAELKESTGKYAIVARNLSKSELVNRIISEDPELQMPPPESNLTLTNTEKALLVKWIKQGAEYKEHWAFLPLERIEPKIKTTDNWVKNDIDRYTLAKLETKGWKPAQEADKSTLLRRVTLDLTGLPPTIEELSNFLDDNDSKAYERVVDRLLASEAYGERMSVEWMDLARFADTHGYTVDRYRDMSPWRDWVIKAFNENLSYDKFVTWQLAGDLLENPTKDQQIATAFNRNHPQNMEGGIIGEEFRVEYVADRANTFGTAFLGLTVECARCHDHKYDPISQKEYFELFSFFNNVNEAGQISFDNATPVPSLLLTNEKIDSISTYIDKEIQNLAIVQDETGFEDWFKSEKSIDVRSEPLIHLDFNGSLSNASLKQTFTKGEIVPDFRNGSIIMDGDSWVDLNGLGAFNKDQEFAVMMNLQIPSELKNGVIFHKGEGAALFNYRGFHLALNDSKIELLMAHTSPDNAIILSGADLPRNEWIEIIFSYDGSSSADGFKFYVNGVLQKLEIQVDNLYKDIMFGRENEPGIQIGARWRGVGIKGALIDDFKLYDRAFSALDIDSSITDKVELQNYYEENVSPNSKARKESLYLLRRQKTRLLDTLDEVMVMKELKSPRKSYILERGLYDNYGEEVFPNTISAVLPFANKFPKNRLGLGQWLFDKDNPMTSRVAVNRIWQQFFGRGLVNSTADFGFQGNLPSHPELLDHLAIFFMENGWDQKMLIKEIVMSATYRQSSALKSELVKQDIENIYLWRGPSQRLTAEMLRDNALSASGLLVRKIGGPSVKPYQPKGLWSINGGKYNRQKGDDLYRRSLYTFWKRSVPNPTQAIFDAPSRNACSVKRQKTNTPLQALVLMNDPVYVEVSRVLAEEISTAQDVESGISQVFTKLTGRNPDTEEMAVLINLRKEELDKYESQPERLVGWLSVGDHESKGDFPLDKLGANAVVASTILNADATVVKR